MSAAGPVRRAGGRIPRIAVLAALGALLAAGGIEAANRHQIPPPGRTLPVPEQEAVYGHGLSPEILGNLVAEGRSFGELPGGARVLLSLDERLQSGVLELFRKFDPPYGVFAAVEPDTGRVRALVGYRKGGESDPWLPLKAIYPAASLIKVITAAAALERGEVAPDEGIPYRGGIYRITKRGIHAKNGRGVPTMSLTEAMAKSANSVFGKVAVENVGGEALAEYLEKFGFGRQIPFGLPVEVSRGEIPRDEYGLARAGAGFGEVYVSPLHVAMIMSAVANGGEMPRPLLIEQVEGEDGTALYQGESEKWIDTVEPETAETLLRMMVKTVEIGTSRRTFGSPASTPMLRDMEVAGKTGSLSGWSPRMRFEWFAGVAPVPEARLAVAALVVNSSHWRIKGTYVGKEAFSAYFGYPESKPPRYGKKRGRRKKGGVVKGRIPKRKPAARTSRTGSGKAPGNAGGKPLKKTAGEPVGKGNKKASGKNRVARPAREG